MAGVNDKAAIDARRASLSPQNPGIVEYAGSSNGGAKGTATVGQGANTNSKAFQESVAKLLGGVKAASEVFLPSSVEVVAAIKNGTIKKTDAINYVEKFNLANAAQIEELSVSAAVKLLEEDAQLLLKEAGISEQLPSTVVSNESTVNQAKPENKGPTPDGSASPKSQMPSTMVSTESDVNSAKPEDKAPSPDGSVSVKKQLPSTEVSTECKDVNKAKPEDSFPKPKNAAADKSTVNHAKPEEHAPAAAGSTNPDAQLPSTQTSTQSDVNSAKPEDKAPSPQGTVNVKSQMPSTPKSAQMLPPPAPTDDIAGMAAIVDAPKDNPMGGEKPEGRCSNAPEIAKIEEAIDLLADFKEIFENLEHRLNKKDKKSKDGGEKKDSPFPPKSEDKPAEHKPEETPKKEEKSDEPKEHKDKPEVPMAAAAYKVERVVDAKNPLDSYYLVSKGSDALFSVSAKQAFYKAEEVVEFNSDEYSKELVAQLNSNGAEKVFKSVYAEKGTLIAQALPTDTMNAPAAPMNAAPEATQDITNDDTKKQSFTDVVMAALAPVISATNGTASEAVDELRGIFTDEAKAKEFEGRLAEKIEQSSNSTDKAHTPPPVTDNPAAGGTTDKDLSDIKNALASIKTTVAVALPEFKKVLAERDELKAKLNKIEHDNILKARTNATLDIATKKASVGLIDEKDIKGEAYRLANLSNDALKSEVKEFQNSLKIAEKVKINSDSNKVETEVGKEPLLAAVPNPSYSADVVTIKTFEWSKGFKDRK